MPRVILDEILEKILLTQSATSYMLVFIEKIFFEILICRKPLYYMFNLVLPAVFITATTILVFYLPAASGEKVSLGVTVLLALTVFLLMVAESMPPQSDTIPLMGKYISLLILCNLSAAGQSSF